MSGARGKLKVLSLFAGIGGFDLGLERTGGFETVAFCEIDAEARAVLCNHWPQVPCYEDVKELTADQLRADGITVDCIVGGFPCQDISLAGAGAGLDGERSGLWREHARLIGEVRPRFVIVENVSALLHRGMDAVLGDLAALGYDAEWHCIPAAAVGAPHRRDRVWIVAHPQCADGGRRGVFGPGEDQGSVGEGAAAESFGGREAVPNPDCSGLAQRILLTRGQGGPGFSFEREVAALGDWWAIEPAVGRVAHGVPDRVGQLRAYGNAVVPQIPELIGRAILAAEAA